MSEFSIKDEDLTGFKGKVVVITGGSSGIGLATVGLLLSLGAFVVSGDIQLPPGAETESPAFLFIQTNVKSWTDLVALFKEAKETYGRIDYVFANAGIGPRVNYLALETDESGELKEPAAEVLDINLKGVINTTCLAVHYLKQQAQGGSIVLMASSTSLQPIRIPDYSSSKAGVLNFGRGMARLVEGANLPIRINTLAPAWTLTPALLSVFTNPEEVMQEILLRSQPPLAVARAAAYLMTNTSRHGDVIYVANGKYTEIEKAILAPAYEKIQGDGLSDDEVLGGMLALAG